MQPLIADLRRWRTRGGVAAEADHTALRAAATTPPLNLAKLDKDLDALWAKVRPAHARGAVLVVHRAGCEQLKPTIAAADAVLGKVTRAERADPRFATLDAAITDYADAKVTLPALVSDDATVLAGKRQRLTRTAAAVIKAFSAEWDDDDIADKVDEQNGPLRERAGLVNPRTLAQARLKTAFESAPSQTLDQVLDRGNKAQALLTQVAADASQPAVADEQAYVRLLLGTRKSVDYASGVKAPKIKLGKKKALADAVAAFGRASAAWTPLDQALVAGTAADRFTKALAALRTLVACADTLVGLRKAKVGGTADALLADDVATLDDGKKRKLTKNAGALLNAADPILLAGLSPRQQAGLLRALRADPAFERDKAADYEALQAKVYRATKLDPGFLQYEAGKRAEIIQDLVAGPGKAQLQQSRDEWPVMDEPAKLAVFRRMVTAHCAKLGFDPPARIVFNDDAAGTSGAFNWGTGTLEINRKGYGFNDFELMMDTIFHENSHNWQMQIAQRMRGEKPPPVADTDEIYQMALLFDANHGHKSNEAYEAQPKEQHSFRAGPKTARSLMRALV